VNRVGRSGATARANTHRASRFPAILSALLISKFFGPGGDFRMLAQPRCRVRLRQSLETQILQMPLLRGVLAALRG
jgi:hypothetical protein